MSVLPNLDNDRAVRPAREGKQGRAKHDQKARGPIAHRPQFPREICDMIIDAVDATDWRTWAACNLTCKAFYHRSRRNLFRTLVVQEHRIWDDSLAAFLASSPEFCALVQELTFRISADVEQPSPISVDVDVMVDVLERLQNVHTLVLRGVACLPRDESAAPGHYWIPSTPGRRLKKLVFGGAVEDFDIASTLRLFSKIPIDTVYLDNSPRWPWRDESDGTIHGIVDPVLAGDWPVKNVNIVAHGELAAYYASLLSGSLSKKHLHRLALSRVLDFGGEILDLLKTLGPSIKELELNLCDIESRGETEHVAQYFAYCHDLRSLALIVGEAWTTPRRAPLHEVLIPKVPWTVETLHIRLTATKPNGGFGATRRSWETFDRELEIHKKLRVVQFDTARMSKDKISSISCSLPACTQTLICEALPALHASKKLVFS